MTGPVAARNARRGDEDCPSPGRMTVMSEGSVMGEGSAGGPLVSVCVPAYKAERHIGATIESVLAQTTEDWELVVVDDASPDGTYDVAARYADGRRVRVARHAANLGPVGNWNHVV